MWLLCPPLPSLADKFTRWQSCMWPQDRRTSAPSSQTDRAAWRLSSLSLDWDGRLVHTPHRHVSGSGFVRDNSMCTVCIYVCLYVCTFNV